jgi:drug/metabolite transporter (DMT)-like permease
LLAKTVMGFSSARNYISLNFALIALFLLPFTPFLFHLDLSLTSLALILAAALVDAAGNWFYFTSFEINDASFASPLLSLSPFFALITLPIAAVWLPLRLTIINGLGAVLIVSGIVSISLVLNRKNLPTAPDQLARNHKYRKVILPVLSSLLFGVNIYLVKSIFTHNYTNPFSYYFLRAVIISLVIAAIFKPDFRWMTRPRLVITSGRVLIVIVQGLLSYYALSLGNPAVTKAASETTPLFVLLIAAIFLKEPINLKKLTGAALIVAGLVLVSI